MSSPAETGSESSLLAAPMTQEAFGALVGITQQAVSDHMARGVITAGRAADQP